MSSRKKSKTTSKHISQSSRKLANPIALNSKILEILDIFLRFYSAKKDKIHVLAYSKAIYGIKFVGREIKSLADAAHIPGVGKGMLEKIDVILKTGTHPKLDEMIPYIGAISNILTKIMGFGTSLVTILKKKYGITNEEELDAYLAIQPIPEMSHLAVLGWKYRTDLASPIPRAEATDFFNRSKANLHSTGIGENQLEVQLAGSYPSGKLFSKDIDILAFYNTKYTKKAALDKLIEFLQATSKNGDMEIVLSGTTKFIGLVKTGDTGFYRHVDIALYPEEVKPYAVLYFTSGKVVNQIMRDKAKKLGYKLNELGLFDRKTGKKINIDEPIIDNIHKMLGV